MTTNKNEYLKGPYLEEVLILRRRVSSLNEQLLMCKAALIRLVKEHDSFNGISDAAWGYAEDAILGSVDHD
jgi:hypothetical protein